MKVKTALRLGRAAGVSPGCLGTIKNYAETYGVTDAAVFKRLIRNELRMREVAEAQLARLHAMPAYVPPLTTDWTDPEIKVTRINNRWHARMFYKGEVRDEMACECQQDIGLICREMLRWFDKMGGTSVYADKARHRQSGYRAFKGRYWSRWMLEDERKKRNG